MTVPTTEAILARAQRVRASQVVLWLVAGIPFVVGVILALVWMLLVVLYSGAVEGFTMTRRKVTGGAG